VTTAGGQRDDAVFRDFILAKADDLPSLGELMDACRDLGLPLHRCSRAFNDLLTEGRLTLDHDQRVRPAVARQDQGADDGEHQHDLCRCEAAGRRPGDGIHMSWCCCGPAAPTPAAEDQGADPCADPACLAVHSFPHVHANTRPAALADLRQHLADGVRETQLRERLETLATRLTVRAERHHSEWVERGSQATDDTGDGALADAYWEVAKELRAALRPGGER